MGNFLRALQAKDRLMPSEMAVARLSLSIASGPFSISLSVHACSPSLHMQGPPRSADGQPVEGPAGARGGLAQSLALRPQVPRGLPGGQLPQPPAQRCAVPTWILTLASRPHTCKQFRAAQARSLPFIGWQTWAWSPHVRPATVPHSLLLASASSTLCVCQDAHACTSSPPHFPKSGLPEHSRPIPLLLHGRHRG